MCSVIDIFCIEKKTKPWKTDTAVFSQKQIETEPEMEIMQS